MCQEGAKDRQCGQPARYELMDRSSVTGQFQSYDPENAPPDVAETTTDQGRMLPFVIRVETGYQNRDQYKIATLRGILPQCSFPDAWSTGQQLVDYHLLRAYLEHPDRWAPRVAWDPQSHRRGRGPSQPRELRHPRLPVLDRPRRSRQRLCRVSDKQLYNAETNPDGVRCTLHDYMVNVLGRRRPTGVRRRIGHGFGGLPVDNVGVQYGLEALRQGRITPAQFVDLNVKAGGSDINLNPRRARFAANQPALRSSYLSGAVNSANNLDRVAIIDLRGPDPGAFHDAYRSFAIRARLEREHRGYRNHVLWYGQVPLVGDTSYTAEGLVAMDRWLTAVERTTGGSRSPARSSPTGPATSRTAAPSYPGSSRWTCRASGPVPAPRGPDQVRHPRTIAGEGIETDVQKCTLKPMRRSDYYPVEFSDAQWRALRKVFPDGVCDWRRRGVDQAGARAWQTYQRLDGSVVYGGRRLGPAPGGSGAGWTSGSFAGWRSGT